MAEMMDFSLRPDGRSYASEEPVRLADRVAQQAKVIGQQALQGFAPLLVVSCSVHLK